MVYCSKCGTNNEDEVKYCISCGANIAGKSGARVDRSNDMCFGRSEDSDEMCFGRPGTSNIGWAVFGIIVVLIGASWVISEITGVESELFWPFMGILVGLIIIISAIMNQRALGGQGSSQIGWIIFGGIILIFGFSGVIREIYSVEDEIIFALVVVFIGLIIIFSALTTRRTKP
jgi:hypothetical protein